MTPGLAALLVVLATVGLVPAAQSASLPRIGVTVDRKVLYSSEHFTAKATAGVTCAWSLEWNGDTRHGRATTFSATFTAPRVTKITKIPLHASCFYNDPAANRARAKAVAGSRGSGTTETLIVTVPPAWRQTIQITVVPAGSAVSPPGGPDGPGGSGSLPNTGGPALWLALLGLGMLLAGVVVTRGDRQRVRQA